MAKFVAGDNAVFGIDSLSHGPEYRDRRRTRDHHAQPKHCADSAGNHDLTSAIAGFSHIANPDRSDRDPNGDSSDVAEPKFAIRVRRDDHNFVGTYR